MSFELTGAFFTDELTSMTVGPWTLSRPEDDLLSFDVPTSDAADPADEAPRWCVDLADDPTEAMAELDRGLRSVEDTEAQLAQFPDRLDRVIDLAGDQAAGMVAFDAVDADSPDARLLADLTALQSPEPSGQQVSSKAESVVPARGRIAELTGKVQSAIETVLRLITHASWVETRIRGRVVARTAMRWSGDTSSEIIADLSPQAAALHSRSVSLATRSRGAWARLIALLLQAAGRIARAAASSNPISWAQALPVLWEYVKGVLAELRTLGALKREANA